MIPVRRCDPEVEKAGTRREQPQAATLGAWVSLDDLIELVAEAYGTDRQALLRRHSRHNEARQILLYLACTWCRGRHALTNLAEQLGPISVGGLTHARYVVAARLAETRATAPPSAPSTSPATPNGNILTAPTARVPTRAGEPR